MSWRAQGKRTQSQHPQFPVGDVGNLGQLMAIAIGMEHEAARRYRELAEEMRHRGVADMARLFDDLARLEADHEVALTRLAGRDGIGLPAPASYEWQLPETFGAEAGEAQVMTPYQALSIAVRNEERAFAFYTYLAAISAHRDVRRRAEALAREELEHLAELRALRRRAYHSELRKPARRRSVSTVEELRALALRLEARARDADAVAARVLDGSGRRDVARVLYNLAADDAARAHALGAVRQPPQTMDAAQLTPLRVLRLALKIAEEVFETYMTVAEQAEDEAVMREAQRLGEAAVARLALLRSLIAEVRD